MTLACPDCQCLYVAPTLRAAIVLYEEHLPCEEETK